MRTDWVRNIAIGLIAGGLIGTFLLMVFPDALADTSGPIKEYYLSDHTRCAVIKTNSGGGVAMSCDWERRNTR